jgi:ATP-dependent helicase HrpB
MGVEHDPDIIITMLKLPIERVLPELCQALERHPAAILSAPPGSGKTTIAPLKLMEQAWLDGLNIIMLQPRRLAAKASAQWMAKLLNEPVGQRVGYRVRLDSKVSPQTRIEVVTEGVLTRRLQRDPELEGVGLVIFDEFHERSLQADLGLALCLDIQQGLREDLKLLMMSATMDCQRVSALLDDCPIIDGAGRSYPVEINYVAQPRESHLVQQAVHGVKLALQEQTSDILLFLPGVGEIKRTLAQLQPLVCCKDVILAPLYGDLNRQAQEQALQPDKEGRRRVVLATSIAETSLTIEGIHTVVDGGWSRRPRFYPNSGLTRLETVRVSLASADQRAGRAGRLAPGVCYRLWDESTNSRLLAQQPPEIVDADLAPLVLEVACWGVSDPTQLSWLDLPPKGAFDQAVDLLQILGALDQQGRITTSGRAISALPLHPRLAHMLQFSAEVGEAKIACDIAAIISERDLIKRDMSGEHSSDIETRLMLLKRWREQGDRVARSAGADPNACRQIDRISQQWFRQLGSPKQSSDQKWSAGALLAQAYPDRLAQRRSNQHSSYLLSGGRGVRLMESDPLNGAHYLVAANLDAGHAEGRIFLAAEIDAEAISQTMQVEQLLNIKWDKGCAAVVAKCEERIGAIVLSSRRIAEPEPEAVVQAMLAGIEQMGISSLPWNRDVRDWQARLLSLRKWQPEADWPDLSDEWLMTHLDEWLAPYLSGISRREHLKQLNLLDIFKGILDWSACKQIDQLAPTHLEMPSGSRRHLTYSVKGEAPILAVRLQELFGLADTPIIANGDVVVTLHLLSPAQRPVQVTQDLKGFWQRTYPEVKKELKGRYPKHYWPDDPWSAVPTSRVKPRR